MGLVTHLMGWVGSGHADNSDAGCANDITALTDLEGVDECGSRVRCGYGTS